jgi:hypothetical protein
MLKNKIKTFRIEYVLFLLLLFFLLLLEHFPFLNLLSFSHRVSKNIVSNLNTVNLPTYSNSHM